MAAESLGTRIKKRRQALGYRSQQQLADRLGVNRTTVSDWENDRYFPGRFQGALEAVLGMLLDHGEPALPRVVSAQMRREIAELVDDEKTRRLIIGLLEGTILPPGDG